MNKKAQIRNLKQNPQPENVIFWLTTKPRISNISWRHVITRNIHNKARSRLCIRTQEKWSVWKEDGKVSLPISWTS